MDSKSIAKANEDKVQFSYNVIATLIAVLGEDISAEELFQYLASYEKFSALATSSCSANLQVIVERGKDYFETMMVIPTPNSTNT